MIDETSKNGWWNVEEEENIFLSNSCSLLKQARKKSENSFQSMSTIQSSTSEAKHNFDVELFIELVRI